MLGDRAADRVASFGKSLRFLGLLTAILIVRSGLNSVHLLTAPFDPYRLILLNLGLSCVTAIQAPIIVISKRQQDQTERIEAEKDYSVNPRAEPEIHHLHKKMHHQPARHWEILAEMQRRQIDIFQERTRDGR